MYHLDMREEGEEEEEEEESDEVMNE